MFCDDNKIGDFTKVNYTDFKKDNSLYLHEAISNGISSMGVVSMVDNDGNDLISNLAMLQT